MSEAFADAHRAELHMRWKRLSALLAALEKQHDVETRAEEKLRLDAKIIETQSARREIERGLSDLEECPRPPLDRSCDEPPVAAPASPARPLRLFYSYAHEDEALRDELASHLVVLQRQGIIDAWHDRRIAPGGGWESEIDARLEEADIVLLLVSPDFVASDYCWGRELARAMERQRRGQVTVVPIILRDVDWAGTPFATLQALPRNARPVTQWEDRDGVYAEICRSLRALASASPT